VKQFVEKPNLKIAQSYLEQGDYLWNSGMFMFRADTLINELSAYAPKVVETAKRAIDNATQDFDFIHLERQSFELSPSASIDCELMERSDNVVVVPLEAQWSDVGSWSALYSIGTKDENNNVIDGDVFSQDTSNTYINASHHMMVTIGVRDLIIVDTPDATFVSTQDKAKEVKEVVQRLRSQNREEQSLHRKAYRPWGWYDVIDADKCFQVKRLHIKPGAKLSLQKHNYRAEHWVVVKGVASIVKGEETFTLCKGQSTYIEIGQKHSLENMGDQELEIIEVQSGTYIGEDDIVRFEDIYGRIKS